MRFQCFFLVLFFKLTLLTKRSNFDLSKDSEDLSKKKVKNKKYTHKNVDFLKEIIIIGTKNSTVCFEKQDKSNAKYLSEFRSSANNNKIEIRPTFRIYSNSIGEILDFHYVSIVFSKWLVRNLEKDPPILQARVFLTAFLTLIEDERKIHYLSYFSMKKNLIISDDGRFNIMTYAVLSLLCYSCNNRDENIGRSLKEIIPSMYESCIMENDFAAIIEGMFAKLNFAYKSKSNQGENVYFPIHLPLISLIYWKKQTLEEENKEEQNKEKRNQEEQKQKTEILKTAFDQMWNSISNRSGILAKRNLSKFFQLEFFDKICEILTLTEVKERKNSFWGINSGIFHFLSINLLMILNLKDLIILTGFCEGEIFSHLAVLLKH